MIASRPDPELDRADDARSSVPDDAVCPALYRRRSEEALARVGREIHAIHGDPRRVVVAGSSAGGHLAAALDLLGLPAVTPTSEENP